MYRNQKILAIIPARGGSKGLCNKNILECAGKPLIAWTIFECLKSSCIDRLIVSTDSVEIAAISKRYGAEVPFMRPNNIASDQASICDVVKHAITELADEHYNWVMILQPTSPLRGSIEIQQALGYYLGNIKSNADTLVSVKKVDTKYRWLLSQNKQGYVDFCLAIKEGKVQRQSLDTLYMPNGAIYLANMRDFKGFYTGRVIPFVMQENISIDIDTLQDLKDAEQQLMQKYDIQHNNELNL